MKEMSKARILAKRSVHSVINERDILTKIKNPYVLNPSNLTLSRFLVNMYYAFQDSHNLYLVMDLLTGGDMRYHICKKRRFTEEQTSKQT
jgi:protein kinase A